MNEYITSHSTYRAPAVAGSKARSYVGEISRGKTSPFIKTDL